MLGLGVYTLLEVGQVSQVGREFGLALVLLPTVGGAAVVGGEVDLLARRNAQQIAQSIARLLAHCRGLPNRVLLTSA